MPQDIEDGGPAFPTDTEHQPANNHMHLTGMSLRDYFAGQSMRFITLSVVAVDVAVAVAVAVAIEPCDAEWETESLGYAEKCYVMADAMLAARKVVQP